MVYRVGILDDYQQVALKLADWAPLRDQVTVDVFTDTALDEALLVERLKDYDIICTMRERTKFFAGLLDKLPKLKLLTTTGMKNNGIDVKYAKDKGIVVSGTASDGNSTLEHIWALLLATVRFIPQDDANTKAGNVLWQTKIPLGLAGKTLGLIGVGKLGAKTAAVSHLRFPSNALPSSILLCKDREGIWDESCWMVPPSHPGARCRGRCRVCSVQGGPN